MQRRYVMDQTVTFFFVRRHIVWSIVSSNWTLSELWRQNKSLTLHWNCNKDDESCLGRQICTVGTLVKYSQLVFKSPYSLYSLLYSLPCYLPCALPFPLQLASYLFLFSVMFDAVSSVLLSPTAHTTRWLCHSVNQGTTNAAATVLVLRPASFLSAREKTRVSLI
jgi:hypothetical protein